MRTVRSSLLFLLLAIAATTAVAVQPPSPRPLGIPDMVPAAYRQEQPDVAWNGTSFIAVWTDSRKTPTWRSAESAIFAGRVDEQGEVIDRYGVEVTPFGFHPRIASNGRRSLVTYSDGSSSFAVPIADNARRAGPAVDLGQGHALDLTSNGSTYCAVVNATYPNGARALILDESGAIVHTALIEGYATSVVAIGRTYYVFSARGSEVYATTVTATGAKTTKHIATNTLSDSAPTAIAGDDTILVSWLAVSQEISAYEYLVIDSELAPLTEVRRVAGGAPYSNAFANPPSLAWDGNIFVMAWGQQSVRIDDDGAQLDAEPVTLQPFIVRFAAAWSGDVTLLVAEQQRGWDTDLHAHALPSLQGIAAIGAGRLMTFSATPQMQPDVAFSESANLAAAVSVDGDGPDSIAITLFNPRGVPNRLRRRVSAEVANTEKEGPSVAAAGDTFVVAWRELHNFNTRIAARRVSADGTLLGMEVPIAQESSFIYFGETAVATNGDVVLIVWDSPTGEIHGRRIRANGEFLDSAPFVISRHPTSEERMRERPAVVWTGSEFLVAWSEHDTYYTAPPAGRTTIRGARVTAEGTVIDASESRTFFTRPGHSRGVDLAVGASGIMLVAAFSSWINLDLMNMSALPLDLAGNPTASEPTRLDAPAVRTQLDSPTVAAVGDSFYALWGESTDAMSRVRGTRLTVDGEIVDRFDSGSSEAYSPAATNAGGEIVIVQSQHDARQASVVRLFATSFAPGEAASRRIRSVRR